MADVIASRISRSTAPHPADGLITRVQVDDGAVMSMLDPRSYQDSTIIWHLTWGNVEGVRHAAASIIECYDYLLSGHLSQAEAIRRLKILRANHKACRAPHPTAR